MTNTQELKALLAQVEAGGRPRREEFKAAFPKRFPGIWTAESWAYAWRAYYSDSLDAAKELHEAVLPGWDVDVECRSQLSDVWIYSPKVDGERLRACHEKPARAWLIAILKALTTEAQDS